MGELPRKALAAALKPILPADWNIVPSSRSIDNLPNTVVQLSQRSIIRLPEAPIGHHRIEFLVTISAPEQSTQAAEDRLDDQVNALIHAIDALGISWTACQKVAVASRRLGYDITLTIISSKE